MNNTKILIADDHAMIRAGIRALLGEEKEITIVGEAATGKEAIEKYKDLQPDLLILDISMPDMNGMEVTQQILKEDPQAKIIILSMYDDEEYISRCIEYGVMGYVIKSETGTELAQAVKNVLVGQTYFSDQVQKIIFKRYSTNLSKKKPKEMEVELTKREIEIVKLISEGLTSKQMANKLVISARTVETHRANLIKKCGVHNAIELVKKVEKLGLI